MVVSKKQAEKASYTNETLREGDFNAETADAGTTISQGEVGEIATCEVGEDGKLSNALAAIIGIPTPANSQGPEGRGTVELFDDGGSAVSDNTQVKLVRRERGEMGGTDITGWMDIGDLQGSSPVDKMKIQPKQTGVRNGYIISMQARNESSDVTIDFAHADTSVKIPVQKGT